MSCIEACTNKSCLSSQSNLSNPCQDAPYLIRMFGGRYRDERILASATGDNAEVDE